MALSNREVSRGSAGAFSIFASRLSIAHSVHSKNQGRPDVMQPLREDASVHQLKAQPGRSLVRPGAKNHIVGQLIFTNPSQPFGPLGSDQSGPNRLLMNELEQAIAKSDPQPTSQSQATETEQRSE